MADQLYRTPSDVKSLFPYPTPNDQNLPYNYKNTPFFGNPESAPADVSQASVTYGNTTLIWGTGNESNPSTSLVKMMKDAVSSGTGRGRASEVTPDWLAARWQEFFYFFAPFIDNSTYTRVVPSYEDNGINYANADYYNGLFQKCFTAWMEYRKNNSNELGDNFVSYLQETNISTNNNMEFRQRSVIMWQFLRVLAMIDRLNIRTIQAAKREIIWQNASKAALEIMAGITIPAISPSDEDYRVPDPDSIQAQSNVMMSIERYRGQYKQDDQKAQLEDGTISYASDAATQQRIALDSFWSSVATMMNSILN